MFHEALGDDAETAKRIIMSAIVRAYKERVKRHAEAIGDNANIFGLGVHFSTIYFLREALALEGAFVTDVRNGSFEVRVGDFTIHFYKAGSKASDEPSSYRMNRSKTQLTLLQENQLSLFPQDEMKDPRHLVVVHAGNPYQGLHWIAVGAPYSLDDNSPASWLWIEPLDHSEIAEQADVPLADFLAFRGGHADQPLPNVKLRLKQDQGTDPS